MTENKEYKCNVCAFEWSSPKKVYDKCPDCDSENIQAIEKQDTDSKQDIRQRRSFGGPGLGAGAPTVCKCPNCGFESPKKRGLPCRNTKCPECDMPLCGSDSI